MDNPEERIEQAVDLVLWYGQTDGAHHKQWVLDQVLRVLLSDRYEFVVGTEGRWDEGIAP